MSLPRPLVAALPVLALALLVRSTPVAAQCFGPDQLNLGACCGPVIPTLPPFPSTSIPGLGLQWGQCTLTQQRPLKVTWTTLAPTTNCTEFGSTLSVFDGGTGLPLLVGPMTIDYTRTWIETDPAGVQTQVWRFTVKADLSSLAPAPPPTPVPACLAPFGPYATAFFYGYMDYASCSTTGSWDNVLVLYHASDRFIHMPGLSNKPGVLHPSISYAIVAPNSGVQPFLPALSIAGGGPVVNEATRDLRVGGLPPGLCITEDHVLQGAMTKLGAGCINTMATNPKQQTLRQFTGITNCVNTAGVNGGWASLNVNFPTIPWFHMVTTSIGTWTNGNVYPGKESTWVDEGLFVHQDPCNGDFVELKYGGSSEFGWTVNLPIPPIVTKFTDIVDNWSAPLGGPYITPICGSVMPSDHLIYVNEP
jgi:hypothetical protein